jgi:hypothetical protein
MPDPFRSSPATPLTTNLRCHAGVIINTSFRRITVVSIA